MGTTTIILLATVGVLAVIVIIRLFVFDARQMKILDERIKTLTTEKEAVEGELATARSEQHRKEVELAEARTSLQRVDELSKQNSELSEKIENQNSELRKAEITLTELRAENKRLTEKAESDKAELDKLQASFRAEFKSLAGEMMEENSKRFKETNKESMDVLLKPFKDNITEFRERVEKIYASENTERGSLRQELKQLMELNRTITEQTNNLTTALRSNSKVQGDFGELILKTILDRSNLEEGIHYSVQKSFKGDEGNNFRPDIVLNLPDGKRIVIDSKMTLTAHADMVEAKDSNRRQEALKNLIKSVQSHIKELSQKSYQELLGDKSPDFVIMFIPAEGAFIEAINAMPALWEEAYKNRIIISSPTNLFALLKIVDDLWRRDQQNRNAMKIAEEGGKLYDKVVGFVTTMEGVQKSINQAAEGCDKAIGQLYTGRGNILRHTENLKVLGAKAAKQLPEKYIEEESLLPGPAEERENEDDNK